MSENIDSRALGQVLIRQGALTADRLRDVLKRQASRASNTKLGEILVSFGYVTPDQLADALAEQLLFERVVLSDVSIPPEIIALVSPQVAKMHKVVPVKEEMGALNVAMADPTDLKVRDTLQLLLERRITPMVTTPKDLSHAIQEYYGFKEHSVDTMLSQVSGDSLSTVSSLSVSSLSVSSVSMSMDSVEMDASVMDSTHDGSGSSSDDEDAALVRLVTLLILDAFRQRASDIHLECFEHELIVRYRIDGQLRAIPNPPPKKMQNAVLSRLKIMAGMDISERRIPQDGRIKLQLMGKDIDLRASTLPSTFGESFVMRILDKSSLALDLRDLGYQEDTLSKWEDLLATPTGIILVTGPTGSGKTTTLYASLNTINTPERKLITVENPVEYVLSGINQVQVQEDIGMTFARALRSILRQSPDIVMVGEIRDMETAEIAIRAALTGHLVFSTLHTNDSPGALNRLIEMGIKPFLVASAVEAVTAQRLVRRICPNCREEYTPTDDEVRLAQISRELLEQFPIYHGVGCDHCGGTGYRGRTTVLELLRMNDHMRELVLANTPTATLKTEGRKLGMRTLRGDGLIKMFQGVTTMTEIIEVTQADDEIEGIDIVPKNIDEYISA
ncbi:MAG: GspE/PulE family protein, partial [Dehalococcoidia bacterium]